jgi:hypothetical protein
VWRDFKERWGTVDITEAKRALETPEKLLSAAAVDPTIAAQVRGHPAWRLPTIQPSRKSASWAARRPSAELHRLSQLELGMTIWTTSLRSSLVRHFGRFAAPSQLTLRFLTPLPPPRAAHTTVTCSQLVWTVASLADGCPQLSAALARAGVDAAAAPELARLKDGSAGPDEEQWCADLLATARGRPRA